MHLLTLAALASTFTVSALADSEIKPRAANCAALAKTTTTIAGAAATLTGPFDLAANAPGQPFDGKYAVSLPPDGSCCSNFFIFGIPEQNAASNGASFFLKGDQLVSIQQGALWTAYDGDTDDPLNSHVLLGSGDDLTSNPVLSCSISESCAMTCSAPGGYGFNCLASPGYQPDWRLSQSKEGSGPGCVEFTPMVIPVSGSEANNGGAGLPSGSSAAPEPSSSSMPASSSSMLISSSSSSSGAVATTTKKTTVKAQLTGGGNGGPANGMSASASATISAPAQNMAMRTAAPVVLANAALVGGILAAL